MENNQNLLPNSIYQPDFRVNTKFWKMGKFLEKRGKPEERKRSPYVLKHTEGLLYAAAGSSVGRHCAATAPAAVTYRIFIPVYSGNDEYLFCVERMAYTTG